MSAVVENIKTLSASDLDRPAIRCGDTVLGYHDLWQSIEKLSRRLNAGSGVVIATDIINPVAWIVADLCLIQCQSISIPLPPFFSPAQKSHALKSAGAAWLLTDQTNNVCDESQIDVGQGLVLIAQQQNHVSHHAGTAKITYTSGTTGTPKGVCLSQSAMETVTWSLLDTLGNDVARRFGGVLPLPVLLENIGGLYAAMLAGGCYYARPPIPSTGFAATATFLFDNAITSCILVPELLQGLLQQLENQPRSLPDMKYIAVGGSKVSPALLERAVKLDLPVYQGYGLSESASVSCLNRPGENRIGSVGKPLPHIKISCSWEGEILLKDPMFLGYTDDDPSPRLYATGDLGHLDKDGYLIITGRKKNVLINSFGRNISPEWPESQLLAEPAIDQVLVVGDARPFLAALIVSTENDRVINQTIEKTNETLPDYAQIQGWKRVSAFTIANNMLTGTGRPKRDVITKRYLSLTETIFNTEITMEPFFNRLERETLPEREAFMQIPLLGDALLGNISKETYMAYLVQAYHHVKHTTPLLMSCGSRLPSSKEWLREAVAEYIEEELGHQEWILSDITHCGGDGETIRHSTPNPATEMMVAYAYDSIARKNPVSFFGMVYVLEGTSINLATPCAEAIGKTLGLSNNCFSYLSSHGSLDLEHMDFFEKLMNRITDAEDQEAIIYMAKRMFGLFGAVFQSLPHNHGLTNAA